MGAGILYVILSVALAVTAVVSLPLAVINEDKVSNIVFYVVLMIVCAGLATVFARKIK